MALKQTRIPYAPLTIDDRRFCVVHENVFFDLCRRARVAPAAHVNDEQPTDEHEAGAVDLARFAARLRERRRSAGLTQAQLAQCAGVRIETVNRLERGRTAPEFATVRKLVTAMNAAEQAVLIGTRKAGKSREVGR